MEWCGAESPKLELDGRSLQPIIDSAEAPSAHPVLYFQWQKKWAVREGDWKLLMAGKAPQLLNLADDEPEAKDYASEKPDIVTSLQALYDAWAKDVFEGKMLD